MEDVAARLRERWSALQEAMELGDVTALAELLADECTVTHLTGVERTKREWLADLDADCTRYHRVEEVEIAVAAVGPAPVVTVRTVTESTIGGFRSSWPLQLRISYRSRSGVWLATSMVAATW